jgi:hypothetical protein
MSSAGSATGLLLEAAEDLRWWRPPHDLEQVLALHRETLPALRGTTAKSRSNDEILADLQRVAGGDGRAPSGTHSDPTMNAALRSSADAPPEDETSTLIRARVAELDRNSSRLSSRAGEGDGILEQIRDRILHPDLSADYGLARAIADDAAWLRLKGAAIWRSSRGERQPAAAQQTVEPCKRCGRWRTGTIAVRVGSCSQCYEFHRNHGAWPTEAIVRRWDYGRGPTPAQISEAKAARPKKKV